MDIQSSELNELFELYPVIIPGWVSPVKPDGIAHGGIPKALYDGQPLGLECLIDPWTELKRKSWTMAVDDRADLYANDDPTPVAGKTVALGEENQRMRLHVPHGRLIQGINRLYYKVTRPSGNVESSRNLLVLYHLRTPDNLALVIPPDVIATGVDAARAALGVEFGFTWSNRRAYDRIRFQLGDKTISWEVPDAPAPVIQKLFTDTFQEVGDNPTTEADFVVTDQLGNPAHSPTKHLDIHLAVAVIVPTLTNVLDTSGNEVPETGTTTSTTLKLVGAASKGQQVEIYDGSGPSAAPKGKATADATTGLWELTITVAAGARRLYAKSLYHSGNIYSNVRTLTVEAAVAPTIDSVKGSPSGVVIPNGGTTLETSVTLTGTASRGQKVQVLDSTLSKGEPTADLVTGIWTLPVTGLSAALHSFTAKALYGTGQVSAPHTFTVETWVDSITDFNNGTSGNWLKGPAGFQGYITNGYFQNITAARSGHAGVLFSQTFRFVAGMTYSFSYQARNFARQAVDLAPSFSVQFASSQLILPVYSVPRTNQWYTQTANFSVAQTGSYSLQIISHQDRGGGNNGDGGNDYDMDNIIVRLVR